MNMSFFKGQMERLQRRFGEKHFDAEFQKLAQYEVGKMSESGFQKIVDIWIGNRKPHDPPLMANFVEARLAEEKNNLSRVTNGALNVVKAHDGLKGILKNQFNGVLSVNDAVELQRMKNKLNEG
jgi:hypothetical protein